MIDTVLLSSNQELKRNPGTFTEIEAKVPGEGIKRKWIRNDLPARFTYYPDQKKLFLECSLPKILFNNNYSMIHLEDLQEISQIIQDLIQEELKIQVEDLSSWKVHKMDLCFNFQVGELVKDYLRYFQKIFLPYAGASIVFQDETVTWKSKSKGLKFYDKMRESKDPGAEGILRMELRVQHQETFRSILGVQKRKKLSSMDDSRESSSRNYWWWKDRELDSPPQITFSQMLKKELIQEELNKHLDLMFPVKDEIFFDKPVDLMNYLLDQYKEDKALLMFGMIQVCIDYTYGWKMIRDLVHIRKFNRYISDLKKIGINLVQRDKKLTPLTINQEDL